MLEASSSRSARSLLVGALALLWAGAASAVPVIFTYESVTNFDATFPSTQTFTPALPFSGTGDIDEAAGTYSLNLPFFSIVLDILACLLYTSDAADE